jgi:hypothetical protein
MIGHEDINWAEKALAGCGVQEQFAEMKVKVVIQPASGATFQGGGPEDDRKAPIEFRR